MKSDDRAKNMLIKKILQSIVLGVVLAFILASCLENSNSEKSDKQEKPTIKRTTFGDEADLNDPKPNENLGRSIRLDPHISEPHRKIILKDLEYLSSINLDDKSKAGINFTKILGTPDLHGPTLLSWIQERIKLILDESTWGNEKNVYGVNWGFTSSPSEVIRFNQETGLNIPAPVRGRRAYGVVTLYALLLESGKHDIRKLDYSRSIYRLSTLFHEARHSDGNRKSNSWGFDHTLCPAGSVHSGLLACDLFSNGPTKIGYYYLKVALENCASCSTVGKDLIRMALIDQKNRFDYGSKLPYGDPAPEMNH